jgi:BASS family bile acid:Na+ symporter
MHLLQSLIPLVLTLSLAGLVFSVGLNSGRGDLLYLLRRPAQLFKAILAVIVIPPIAAGLLISLAPLEPVVKGAIMVMAVSPVPPFVPGKQLSAGARKEYAYGVYAAMALITIVSVPATLAIASAVFEHKAFLPLAGLGKTVIAGVIFPLLLGWAIHHYAPEAATRFWPLVYKISIALVALAFVPILIKVWPAIMKEIGNGAVVSMALVAIVALLGGHFLGGPDPRDRVTLAIASSIRHPGLALAIAGASFQNPRVSAGILLFVLVGLIVGLPYTIWMKRAGARMAAHGNALPG